MSIFAAPPEDDGPEKGKRYDAKRSRENARQREDAEDVREISPLPAIVDPVRRDRCLADLRTALETWFPKRFPLAWSKDHLAYIGHLARAINDGGSQATAMPRGSGKTTIAEGAAIWGILSGRTPFAMLIGATNPAALELLQSIRMELETNDVLLEDFPEVCYPLRRLEGLNQRRLLYQGNQVRMHLLKYQILLPDIPGSLSAGSIIRTAGLTGRIRGAKYTRADGTIIRPTIAIIDDPQTKRSAKSDTQCTEREGVINSDVAGLAGPGKSIALVMPCTVIRKGDLADRYLDHDQYPEWHGQKAGLLKSLPNAAAMELWQQYWEVRREGLRQDDSGAAGNAFYEANREAMDAGAIANWPERKLEHEVSAIQHFMNIYLKNPSAAMAEYQNEPEDLTQTSSPLDPEQIIRRVTHLAQGVMPVATECLSVGIDVQGALLYWLALASERGPTSSVIDYGTWPQQRTAHFTLRDATRTIQKAFPERDAPGQLHGALETLIAELVGREFAREDGTKFRVGRIVIDARWETENIIKFIRSSTHKSLLIPAQGLTAKQLYLDRKPLSGDRHETDYKLKAAGHRLVRVLQFDSAKWISRVINWARTPVGSTGALTLWKAHAERHRMFAEHLTAEYCTVSIEKGTNKEITTWALKPGVHDNHLLDALKMAAIGNYEQGAKDSIDPPKTRKRLRGGWTEL